MISWPHHFDIATLIAFAPDGKLFAVTALPATLWRIDIDSAQARFEEAQRQAVQAGDVVVCLGAGDITKTGPELLAALGGASA